MADDLHTVARNMRQQLLGKDFAAKLDKAVYTDPMMDKFAVVARQIAFGTVWTRPGLDLKTRTMITLTSVPTMPQVFVALLALSLLAMGYLKIRQGQRSAQVL